MSTESQGKFTGDEGEQAGSSTDDRHRILDVAGVQHLIDASNWDEAAAAIAKFGLAMRAEAFDAAGRALRNAEERSLPLGQAIGLSLAREVLANLASRIRGRRG